MKLSQDTTFDPGYYLVTMENGHGIVIEHPEMLDDSTIQGSRVSLDMIGDDGGIIIIDISNAVAFEVIGEDKLSHSRQMNSARAQSQLLQNIIQLKQFSDQAKQDGVLQPSGSDDATIPRGPKISAPNS